MPCEEALPQAAASPPPAPTCRQEATSAWVAARATSLNCSLDIRLAWYLGLSSSFTAWHAASFTCEGKHSQPAFSQCHLPGGTSRGPTALHPRSRAARGARRGRTCRSEAAGLAELAAAGAVRCWAAPLEAAGCWLLEAAPSAPSRARFLLARSCCTGGVEQGGAGWLAAATECSLAGCATPRCRSRRLAGDSARCRSGPPAIEPPDGGSRRPPGAPQKQFSLPLVNFVALLTIKNAYWMAKLNTT